MCFLFISCGWRVPEAVWGCWMLDVLQVASLWRLISDSASSQLSLLSSSVLLWLSLATQQFQEQLALAGMQPLCSVELVTTVPLEVRRQWAPSPERARDLLSRLLNGVDGDGRPPPAGSHSNKIASCEPDEDLSTSFTAQLFLQTSSSSATLGPPASPSLAPGTSSQDPNSLVLSAVQDVYRELLLFAQKKEVLRVTMEELCSAVGVHKVCLFSCRDFFGFLVCLFAGECTHKRQRSNKRTRISPAVHATWFHFLCVGMLCGAPGTRLQAAFRLSAGTGALVCLPRAKSLAISNCCSYGWDVRASCGRQLQKWEPASWGFC